MALAEINLQEVKDRYEGDLDTRFTNQYLITKLADSISFVASTVPTAAARRASGLLSDNDYFRVVSNVMLRVVRNPGGMQSESEGGAAYRVDPNVASGDWIVTDKEYETLAGAPRPKGGNTPIGTYGMGLDSGWGS